VAEEMLLMDLLSDAHKIRDRLKRLAIAPRPRSCCQRSTDEGISHGG